VSYPVPFERTRGWRVTLRGGSRRPCGDGPRRSSVGCSAARPLDTRADSGRGTSDGHAARGAEIRVLGAVLRRVTGPLLHHIGVSNAAKEIADEPIQSLAS